MDGVGNIQVNRLKMENLQYRLIIKLNNLDGNYDMLLTIAKVIGGSVKFVNDKKEVI